MDENKEHMIILTELEMKLILESIDNTQYFGRFSDTVSSVREKMAFEEKKE